MAYARRIQKYKNTKSTGVFRQRWSPRIRKTRNIIFILSNPPIPVTSDHVINYEWTLPCINEIQSIYFGGQSSSVYYGDLEEGTFTITYNGETTSDISYNYTSLSTYLESLTNIGSGNVMEYADGNAYKIEFIQGLSGQNLPLMTATPSGLKAKADTIDISQTQSGADPTPANPSNSVFTSAVAPVNEVQFVDFAGATTGTFDLSGNSTSATVNTLDTSGVQSACDTIWGSGNTNVTLNGSGVNVEFINAYAASDIAQMSVINNSTDSSPYVSTTTNGVTGVNQVDQCTFSPSAPISGSMVFDGNNLSYSSDASTLSLSGATASGTPSSGTITTTWSDFTTHTPFSVSAGTAISSAGQPQIADVSLSDNPTEGAYSLTFGSDSTGTIAYNDTPTMSGWTVTGSFPNWTLTRDTNGVDVSLSSSELTALRKEITLIEIVAVQDGICIGSEIDVTADHIINLEHLLNLSIDQIINNEYLLSLQSNSIVNFENLTGISSDYSVNMEGLLLITQNQITNLEYLLSLVKDNSANVEFLTTVNADGSISLEWLSTVAGNSSILIENLAIINSDGQVNLEWRGNLTKDFEFVNLEYLSNILNDNTANIEYTLSISGNSLVNLEYLLGIYNDNAINIENLLTIAKNFQNNIDYNLTVDTNKQINYEYTLIFSNDQVINYENLSMISIDQVANIEYLLRLINDSQLPIEYVLTINSDGAVNIEWNGITGVTTDSEIQIEFLASIDSDGQITVESLGDIAREDTANTESLASISDDKVVQVEGLLGLSADSSIPLEFLISVGSIDSTTLVEYLSTLDISDEVRLEYLTGISSALATNIEYSTNLSVDQLLNLEHIVDFESTNFTVNLEFLSLIEQDALINYEHRLPTVALFPLLKWTLQNRKRVYIYNEDRHKLWSFNTRENRYWISGYRNKTWTFLDSARQRVWTLPI